jgi:hypothetical protein
VNACREDNCHEQEILAVTTKLSVRDDHPSPRWAGVPVIAIHASLQAPTSRGYSS